MRITFLIKFYFGHYQLYLFLGWGTHTSGLTLPYLTVAAGLGVTLEEVNVFIKKIDKVLLKYKQMITV